MPRRGAWIAAGSTPLLPPGPDRPIDFGSSEDRRLLTDMLGELSPELVVVDSLSSITLNGENAVEDVRDVLGFLSAVARRFNAGLLLIHHLRKRGTEPGAARLRALTSDDFRGSSHIIAMARSVLALSLVQTGPQPDRNGPRRLEVIKTNLCAYPPPLGVAFESGSAGAPGLRCTDPPRPTHKPKRVDECAAWLLQLLKDAAEPLKPKEVLPLAQKAGFTSGVLYRARKSLEGEVVDTRRATPDNRWALAQAEDE